MTPTNAHLWGDLADDEAAAALLGSAMSTIDSRVEYGDARLVEAEELRLYHQLDRDPDERLEKSVGIGVRVLVDGSWGFAAAPLSDAAVPARIAERAITVARAGVGAGPHVDGQLLVWTDWAGFTKGRIPSFVKQYANLRKTLGDAVLAYRADVESGEYPGEKYSFHD